MKALLIPLAFLVLSGFLAAQTEVTPPPPSSDETLKKFGSIIAWGKAKKAYDEGMKAFRQSKGDEASLISVRARRPPGCLRGRGGVRAAVR